MRLDMVNSLVQVTQGKKRIPEKGGG